MAALLQLAMSVAAVPHLPEEETTPSVDVEIASPDQQHLAAAAAPSMAVFPPAADEEEEEEAVAVLLSGEFFTCWSSLSESTDDETTRRTTTESMFYIPTNGSNDVGRRRRKVRSWSRGSFLGRGSFGMVFEGITNEGVFFAVKEVYLDDQGDRKSVV